MAKEKLKVPANCPLEIWVGDEEGCFPEGAVTLPLKSEYLEITKKDRPTISMPPYITITADELTPKIQKFWYFAKGSFNAAFRNFEVAKEEDDVEATKSLLFPPIMFKLPLAREKKDAITALDKATRAVRVFNECNRDVLTTAVKNSKDETGKKFFGEAVSLRNGWLAPYIIGEQSTSEQKCKRLVALFNENQRIVVDSYVPDNLRTDEAGKTWIIDSGIALQLGSGDFLDENTDAASSSSSSSSSHATKSPKSEASFCAWSQEDGGYSQSYEHHFLKLLFPTEYQQKFPLKAPELIEKLSLVQNEMLLSMALLYIQKEYPKITDVSCLLENKMELIQSFAAAYIEQNWKKHFDSSHEPISVLKINADEHKLIGINESAERLAELKKNYIDCIKLLGATQSDKQEYPKTPGSAASMQASGNFLSAEISQSPDNPQLILQPTDDDVISTWPKKKSSDEDKRSQEVTAPLKHDVLEKKTLAKIENDIKNLLSKWKNTPKYRPFGPRRKELASLKIDKILAKLEQRKTEYARRIAANNLYSNVFGLGISAKDKLEATNDLIEACEELKDNLTENTNFTIEFSSEASRKAAFQASLGDLYTELKDAARDVNIQLTPSVISNAKKKPQVDPHVLPSVVTAHSQSSDSNNDAKEKIEPEKKTTPH